MFRGLGFRGLGFRGLGFRGLGVRGLGVSGFVQRFEDFAFLRRISRIALPSESVLR